MTLPHTSLVPQFPLVFVDLETTGGSAFVDRITEVGVIELAVDGTVREWSSLVNPDAYISPFIQDLTGISNAMVARAPRFARLAVALHERLDGCLFLAHNARFDYGFLKSEFSRVGIDFRADVLCTVRLSRKLYPEHERHNLDSLIARHQLHTHDRHRALGDARLIWQWWQKMQHSHSQEVLEQTVTGLINRERPPSHLAAGALENLPEGPGVYVLYGDNDVRIHLGKSLTLRKRVQAHFYGEKRTAKALSLLEQVRRVECFPVESEAQVEVLFRQMKLKRRA
jgi:DNA polymerase-3 subunit epsilon